MLNQTEWIKTHHAVLSEPINKRAFAKIKQTRDEWPNNDGRTQPDKTLSVIKTWLRNTDPVLQ